jgi:NAD(P)-dependent dehydrogenase (short-subunit alcohol dehydrogenase family)
MIHTIVVGGTRGLGREVARIFSARGDRVSVIGRRDPNDDELKRSNVKVWVATLDSADATIETIQDIVETSGRIDNIVFCQRYRGSNDIWAGELATSLTTTKTILEAADWVFKPDTDCSAVIVGSVFNTYVDYQQPVGYHVAKAGLLHLARYFAVKLGAKRIRVNSVSPSTFVKDESREFYLTNQNLQNLYAQIIPLARMGTARDTAQLVKFLCSESAAFITGQNIVVDGGLSLVWSESMARALEGL